MFRETGEVWLAICPNGRRNAETLLPLIQQHVKPGTHIISDCWPAYNTLDQLGERRIMKGVTLIT